MSIATISKVAALRASGEDPTRASVGKGAPQEGDERARVTDLLISLVPVELIAPYTLAAAAIVGAVADPELDPDTMETIEPDQYEGWRWGIFVILVAGTFVITWIVSRGKQPADRKRFPALEVFGATVAAAGWALAIPGSPIDPYLEIPEGTFVPLVVGLAAVVGTTVIAKALQTTGAQPHPEPGPEPPPHS